MYILSSKAEFDAAHFLSNYNGKCHNIHGHRWAVYVSIKGELNNGMVVDFTDLKSDIKEMCDYFDHSFIVEKDSLDQNILTLLQKEFLIRVVDFRTTAENFAKYFYDTLSNKYEVESVKVYETPNNMAEYRK